MSKLILFGQEYQLAYTVAAQATIAQRFGGIEKIDGALTEGNAVEIMDNVCFMASAMMLGAENRERVRCMALGLEYTGQKSISYDCLREAFQPSDVKAAATAIMEAIREGSTATVELKEEKGKNADATP